MDRASLAFGFALHHGRNHGRARATRPFHDSAKQQSHFRRHHLVDERRFTSAIPNLDDRRICSCLSMWSRSAFVTLPLKFPSPIRGVTSPLRARSMTGNPECSHFADGHSESHRWNKPLLRNSTPSLISNPHPVLSDRQDVSYI